MYHKAIYRDAANTMRADLRGAALHDWESLPVDGHYVWTWVGPFEGVLDPLSPPFSPGLPVSGLVADIAVGATPDHLAFATRGGGVWHSTNGGTDWNAKGDRLPSLQTVTVSMADVGPDPILICGTGELSNEQARFAGLVGVFRSVDGGKTWSVADGGIDATIFGSHDINQVLAVDADRLLVATRVGLFYSKDGGRNFGQAPDHVNGLPVLRGFVSAVVVDGTEVGAVVSGERVGGDPVPPDLPPQLAPPIGELGLYRSTLTPTTLPNLTLSHRTLDRVADPGVGQTVLAKRGTFWLMSAAKVGLEFNSFSAPPPIPPHHSIQFTKRDPTIAGGWGALSIPVAETEGTTWYAHAVELEPMIVPPAPHAWFGTVQLFRLRISLVGGRWTWSQHPVGGRDVHDDQHVLRMVQPAPGVRRVLSGNDGGFYQTEDDGATFIAKNKQGAFLFWNLALARKDATTLRVLGGLQDNQSVIGEGGIDGSAWSWKLIFTGGDGGNAAFIPRARDRTATEDPQAAFLTMNGTLRRAEQSGLGWSNSPIPAADTLGPLNKFPFSETVAVARTSSGDWERVYFAASAERNGPGTLRARDGLVGAFVNKRAFAAMVTAMAAAPENVTTESSGAPVEWKHLWVGLANGQVFFSPDAGATFVPHPTGGSGPVTGIAVDPQNSQRVAVVHGGFADATLAETSRKVFLTENRGADFSDISGRRGASGFVPDIPALSVAFSRTNPTQLLVATDLGVLVTTGPRFGAQWSRLGVGLPKLPCTGLGVVNDNPTAPVPALADGVLPLPVAVSTFGRGVWLLTHPAMAQAFAELDGAFGAVRVGTTARRTITVYNVGGAPLRLTAASAPAPFGFEPLLPHGPERPRFPDDLPLPIAPGANASWTVTCSPVAAGIQSTDLTLTFDTGAPATPTSVSCEAVTGGPPRLALWPRTVKFGDVPDGDSVEQTIHFANRGASDLTITRITPDGGASAQLSLSVAAPPSIVIHPGEELPVTLRFQAAGAGTTQQTTWTIESDDPLAIRDYWKLRASGNVVIARPHGSHWGWWVLGGAAVIVIVVVCVYEETKSHN